jgi:hypothetical protein
LASVSVTSPPTTDSNDIWDEEELISRTWLTELAPILQKQKCAIELATQPGLRDACVHKEKSAPIDGFNLVEV